VIDANTNLPVTSRTRPSINHSLSVINVELELYVGFNVTTLCIYRVTLSVMAEPNSRPRMRRGGHVSVEQNRWDTSNLNNWTTQQFQQELKKLNIRAPINLGKATLRKLYFENRLTTNPPTTDNEQNRTAPPTVQNDATDRSTLSSPSTTSTSSIRTHNPEGDLNTDSSIGLGVQPAAHGKFQHGGKCKQ
jgi:hypothetical protein